MRYGTRAAGVALALVLLTSTTQVRADAVERLMGFHLGPEGLTIQVESGGCTNREDFRFEVEGRALTILRTNPDVCRALAVAGVTLTFTWSEVGVGDESWREVVVQNPLRFHVSGAADAEGPRNAGNASDPAAEAAAPAVCRRGRPPATVAGEGDGDLPPVEECGPGMQCCYPCGIPGCDWVCLPECPVGIP